MVLILKQVIVLFFVSILSTSVLAASSWRCGSNLVSQGNTMAEVVNRCGLPKSKTFLGWGRRVTNGWYGGFNDVPIEEWVYSVSDSLYYVLKFEGDSLREITSHYNY